MGGPAAQRSLLFEEGADARLVRHRKPIAGLRAGVYVHLRAPLIGRGSTRNLLLLQEENTLLIFRELGKVNPRYILTSRKSEDHLVLCGFCTLEDAVDFENGLHTSLEAKTSRRTNIHLISFPDNSQAACTDGDLLQITRNYGG